MDSDKSQMQAHRTNALITALTVSIVIIICTVFASWNLSVSISETTSALRLILKNQQEFREQMTGKVGQIDNSIKNLQETVGRHEKDLSGIKLIIHNSNSNGE